MNNKEELLRGLWVTINLRVPELWACRGLGTLRFEEFLGFKQKFRVQGFGVKGLGV